MLAPGAPCSCPTASIWSTPSATERRLKIRNDTTLKLSPGAIIKAIPNGAKDYALLTITGSSNVTVTGGTLEGDRSQHTSKEGEWGMGLSILEGSKNVTISGVTSKEMWGDGFYVQGAKNVTFCSVVADHNRRQGLSVIEVDRLEVTNSVFSNTQGTRPSAGIDLEPDDVKQQISNVRIHNSKFLNNKGAGIVVAGKKHASLISRLEITENLFVGELPLKIEYSPEVLQSQICRNRQIVRQAGGSGRYRPIRSPKRFSSFSRSAVTAVCRCAADAIGSQSIEINGAPRSLRRSRGVWFRAARQRLD